jgi:hypothetical protein
MKEGLNPNPNPAELASAPLPPSEASQYLQGSVYGDPDIVSDLAVNHLDQVLGRDALSKLVLGEVSPSEVPPIYITDLRKRKHNPSATMYVSQDIPAITLDSSVAEALETTGAVVFVPKEDERFGYRWIDIYQMDEEGLIDHSNTIGSLRINTEHGRIESQGWYGPEQQVFMDFISGRLQLDDPNEIPPFIVRNPKGNTIYFGRDGDRYITTSFGGKTTAKNFTIIPRYDHTLGYFWIEGYEQGDSAEPLFTRRVLAGESFEDIKIIDWKGPQIQSLIDWAYGKIETAILQEVEILFDPAIKHSNLYFEQPHLKINLSGNRELKREQPVYAIPREKGPYKWIDIQQDKESGKRKTVSSALLETALDGKPTLRAGWQGYEKQALADYIDGRIDFSLLEPIVVTLNGVRQAHLMRYKDKALVVALRSTIFKEGDGVTFTPTVDGDGNLILEVTKSDNPDQVLAKCSYNPENNSFNTTSLEAALSQSRKPLHYWTPEKIREMALQIAELHGDLASNITNSSELNAAITSRYEGGWVALRRDIGLAQADATGIFIDKEERMWAPLSIVAKEAQISIHLAEKILSQKETQTKQGRGFNSKKQTFFNLQEAVELVKEYQSSKSTEQSSSKKEANEYLRDLVFGDDEL